LNNKHTPIDKKKKPLPSAYESSVAMVTITGQNGP